MRIHTALVALVLATVSIPQLPVRAQADGRAELRLFVVDETRTALPGATVTIFTLDGKPGVTVTADEKGVAVFSDLPAGLAEVYARSSGYAPYIEATSLRGGRNSETATLHSRPSPTGTSTRDTDSESTSS